MADIKISDLPAASALTGVEKVEVLQSSANRAMTVDDILAYINSKQSYSANVGDGSAVNIVLTHNLNTRDVHVTLRSNSTPWAEVTVVNEATSVNTVTLRFVTAPTAAQYRATITK